MILCDPKHKDIMNAFWPIVTVHILPQRGEVGRGAGPNDESMPQNTEVMICAIL